MRPLRSARGEHRRIVRMKTNTLLALSLVAVGTLFAGSAQAGWSVSVSVGGPVYYPAPMVVAPLPYLPARVYYPPPMVYYPPRPVYAPVVYAPPYPVWGRQDYGRYERHDRRSQDRHGQNYRGNPRGGESGRR